MYLIIFNNWVKATNALCSKVRESLWFLDYININMYRLFKLLASVADQMNLIFKNWLLWF